MLCVVLVDVDILGLMWLWGLSIDSVAIINLVRNDFVPELSADLDAPIESGQLIINLRAEGDPETLNDAVQTALKGAPANLSANLDHLEHFRPGKPEPTHRVTDLM